MSKFKGFGWMRMIMDKKDPLISFITEEGILDEPKRQREECRSIRIREEEHTAREDKAAQAEERRTAKIAPP